jgi:hypothetical protein
LPRLWRDAVSSAERRGRGRRYSRNHLSMPRVPEERLPDRARQPDRR